MVLFHAYAASGPIAIPFKYSGLLACLRSTSFDLVRLLPFFSSSARSPSTVANRNQRNILLPTRLDLVSLSNRKFWRFSLVRGGDGVVVGSGACASALLLQWH